MTTETGADAAESVLEQELTGAVARADAVKQAAMRQLGADLDAAVDARTRVWQSVAEAALAGNSADKISKLVAGKGLAGEEMVRVHIAATKRLASVQRVLELGVDGVEAFRVAGDSPRGQVGRMTGISLVHAPAEVGAVLDLRAAKTVLELVRAAGFIPADGLSNGEAVGVLAAGNRLRLVPDPTFS